MLVGLFIKFGDVFENDPTYKRFGKGSTDIRQYVQVIICDMYYVNVDCELGCGLWAVDFCICGVKKAWEISQPTHC